MPGMSQAQGTPSYVEEDTKIAFWVAQGTAPLAELRQAIYQTLVRESQSGQLAISKLLKKPVTIPKAFTDYVYYDSYIDTEDLSVLNSRSSYRLRYRFASSLDYYLHQFLPQWRSAFPNRCEIQFKGPYQQTSDGLKVREHRFEFRNESPPFNLTGKAPPPPWPREQYLQYAYSGSYQGMKMAPFVALKDVAPSKKPLQQVLAVATQRHRLHLGIDNPWGQKPNPEQFMIITIDRSRLVDVAATAALPDLLEIEIEIDRSTKVGLAKLAALRDARVPYGGLLVGSAVAFTAAAQHSIHADLFRLRQQVKASAEAVMNRTALAPNFKYANLMNQLRNLRLGATPKPRNSPKGL